MRRAPVLILMPPLLTPVMVVVVVVVLVEPVVEAASDGLVGRTGPGVGLAVPLALGLGLGVAAEPFWCSYVEALAPGAADDVLVALAFDVEEFAASLRSSLS